MFTWRPADQTCSQEHSHPCIMHYIWSGITYFCMWINSEVMSVIYFHKDWTETPQSGKSIQGYCKSYICIAFLWLHSVVRHVTHMPLPKCIQPICFWPLFGQGFHKRRVTNGFIDCWFLSSITKGSVSHLCLMTLLNTNLSSLNECFAQMGSSKLNSKTFRWY